MNERLKDLAKRSEITKEIKMTELTINAFENYSVIKYRRFPSVEGLINIDSGKNCAVAGSGPSLDESLTRIHGLSDDLKPDIICGPSQAMSIRGHGLIPKYIVMFDPHQDNFDYLRPDRVDWTGTSLIFHPSCDPRTVREWKETAYIYRVIMRYHYSHVDQEGLTVGEFLKKYSVDTDHPVGWYLRDEHLLFHKNTLKRAYPEYPVGILSASCTPSIEMSIASMLGYKNIFLIGADNGFIDGKSRADGYMWDSITQKIIRSGVFKVENMPKEILVRAKNGVITTMQLLSYRDSMIATGRYLSASTNVVEVSNGKFGTLDFYPKMTWDDYEAGDDIPYMGLDERVKKSVEDMNSENKE